MWKKTITIILLFSLLILPVFWKAYANVEALKLEHYYSEELELLLGEVKNRDLLNKLILLPTSDFSYEEVTNMIYSVSKVPDTILEALVKQNVQLYLFQGPLTDVKGYEHLKGIQPRGYSTNGPTWEDVPGIGGSKLVLAKVGHSNLGNGHGSVNLELHELAHSIDRFVYGNIRYDENFQEIWKQEAPKLFPNRTYFLHFIEEYFAESFAMYYLNETTRGILHEKAPLTYEFLEDLNNIKGNMEQLFIIY